MDSITNEATTETTSATTTSSKELTIKAVQKRFEGLLAIKTKAIKGKGAWYWQHLDPILLHSDDGAPNAVKLKCSLCHAVFSASNPSRTATEHLKKGTCPNFQSPSSTQAQPISSIPPLIRCGKRSPSSLGLLALMDSSLHGGSGSDVIHSSSSTPPQITPHNFESLPLSKDSADKLKSPNPDLNPLSTTQSDSAMSSLSDWFYESCNYTSFSSINHPKFQSFLQQVGLPSLSPKELVGTRLDSKYNEARSNSESRIQEAMFFQLSCIGWKSHCPNSLVSISLNLPNGATVFRRIVSKHGQVTENYVEEIVWKNISEVCGNQVSRCVGVVSDKFNMRSLENRNHWMVNLSCQMQGFKSLIKDFMNEVPWFKSIANDCLRVCDLFNANTQVRRIYFKYLLQEFGYNRLLRVDTVDVFSMLDDVHSSARVIRLTVLDDMYKLICLADLNVKEVGDMIQGLAFWNNLEAVHSFIALVKGTIKEMQYERPLVGRCLPLWEELRSKIKTWCSKFNIDELMVKMLVDKRFVKNYHPAWSAAFILDPLYLVKAPSGRYLPAFKYLTREQEKDVDMLITRLASKEEAHIVLMELMKWRLEGLDSLYAQAVQLKEPDPRTNRMRVVNPKSSRLVWETYLKDDYKLLSKVAVRLIFLHATSFGYKCNSRMVELVLKSGRSRVRMERVQKLVFVAANSKLERRCFSSEEEKDGELFGFEDDDVVNEACHGS